MKFRGEKKTNKKTTSKEKENPKFLLCTQQEGWKLNRSGNDSR